MSKKSCCRIHDLIAQCISYTFVIKKSALETNKTGNLVPTFKIEGLSIEPSQRTTTREGYSYVQYINRLMAFRT